MTEAAPLSSRWSLRVGKKRRVYEIVAFDDSDPSYRYVLELVDGADDPREPNAYLLGFRMSVEKAWFEVREGVGRVG